MEKAWWFFIRMPTSYGFETFYEPFENFISMFIENLYEWIYRTGSWYEFPRIIPIIWLLRQHYIRQYESQRMLRFASCNCSWRKSDICQVIRSQKSLSLFWLEDNIVLFFDSKDIPAIPAGKRVGIPMQSGDISSWIFFCLKNSNYTTYAMYKLFQGNRIMNH